MNEYRGLEGEWHDLFWAEEGVDELPLVEEFLSDVEGEVLYIGSGSGRLLGPLTGKGIAITGLEASEEMVTLSRQRWPEAAVNHGRWEDVQGEQEYAAIIVPAFTLQLLEQPMAALEKIRTVVRNGGGLYLSLFFPWIELSGELPAGKWYEDRELVFADGTTGKIWTRHKVDERKATLRREHRYCLIDQDGKTLKEEVTRQRIRWFTDGTLERMLEKAGWKIEREIANFGEESDDDLVYVVTLFLRAV